MTLVEDAKRFVERITGFGRPKPKRLADLVRPVNPQRYRFKDDGTTPNNPSLPLLLYRRAIVLPKEFDPAAVIEAVFARNGWKDSWRDGVYDFLHFHTKTHEVLGIARGSVRVQFGGDAGKVIPLKAGDAIILPAGTGHRRVTQSDDLLVVGAYPATGHYDEPKPDEVDHDEAVAAIAKTRLPVKDPIYGNAGPLRKLWRKKAVHAPRRSSRAQR
ncbi:MAG TPA: cupin [Stellaceae bacterium]|jgi:uncharacterized protein YjlB|nr:cupin [Stellaceae bacterium]